MSAILVWILITGSEGGHVPPAQLGPFVDAPSCQRVADLKILARYDRTCVQVSMPAAKEIK